MKTLLAFALALFPVAVLAQSNSQDGTANVNEARERFRRGVELFHEGSLEAALAELQRAYELAPNYRLLFNLGQIQTERHDYVAALEFFDAYLEQGGSDIAPERRKQVESTRAELKTRVASLSIQTSVADVILILDGVPAGKLPLANPVVVNAGVHQLQLRKHGFETLTHTLTIAGSENVVLDLPLSAQQVDSLRSKGAEKPSTARALDPPAAAAPDTPRAGPSRAPLWISLFAAAALSGGAVAFGLLARSADADLDREFNHYPADRSRVEDLRDQVQRDAALCDGLAAGAVVAAGLSLYFALSGSSSTESAEHTSSSRFALAGRGVRFEQHF